MIYNTTYKNRDIKEEIDAKMGKPFSFWQRIKLGRIGSSRMIIKQVSIKLEQYTNTVSDLNYINIELRPKGILVHITKALNRYSWTIPYYQLSLFDSNLFSIHSEGQFIKVRKDNYYKLNQSFIKQIIKLKTAYSNKYSIDI